MREASGAFRAFLSVAGASILFAGGWHAVFGVAGDWLVGITPPSSIDPSLDSQNRFYGASFLLYGMLLIVCVRDIARYGTILRILLTLFFVAGLVRGISVPLHGWPSIQIGVLWAAEILLPVIAWVWLGHELKTRPTLREPE
jgi:hypothetical protein